MCLSGQQASDLLAIPDALLKRQRVIEFITGLCEVTRLVQLLKRIHRPAYGAALRPAGGRRRRRGRRGPRRRAKDALEHDPRGSCTYHREPRDDQGMDRVLRACACSTRCLPY